LVEGAGGGDAFAAGYIDGMMRWLDEEDYLRIGNAVGLSCARSARQRVF
jgi:sugar/nucleoside kinase (ribokinase family)